MLTPKAAALKYEANKDAAPKVVAKGRGAVAETIIAKAEEFNIPLFQNESLASALLATELDDTIDPKLFEAVAKVFVWLMRSEERAQVSS